MDASAGRDRPVQPVPAVLGGVPDRPAPDARSWVYRLWVLMTVLAAGGFLLYRVGLHKEAGIFQTAAAQSGDLFRVMVVGSLALVVVLAVSAISSERGTVADSVSQPRNQPAPVLPREVARAAGRRDGDVRGAGVGGAARELLPLQGRHAIGPVAHGWAGGGGRGVRGAGGDRVVGRDDRRADATARCWASRCSGWCCTAPAFCCRCLPEPWPSPGSALGRLKFVLQGQYNESLLSDLVLGSAILCSLAAVVGLIGFSRRDV